ncbi:MAG: SDR family oxidoreductase [Chloroflexi bacterium]|nr:SDR family oxidoreductase [Chloroflexota bacterium]
MQHSLQDLISLKGRSAIVTGAGAGIGKGIALALAQAGSDVAVVARTKADVEATASEIKALGRKALPIAADVTRSAEVDALVKRVLDTFGKIDILVNNVGGGGVSKPVIPLPGSKRADGPVTDDECHRVLDVNLTSAFYCCRAVGPHMLGRGSGKIINITSPTSERPIRRQVPYSSAKAAINQFTRALAQEWAPYHVNVNAIGPGLTVNRMLEAKRDLVEKMAATLPFGRTALASEIGMLAVYLASPASDFMTGEVVYIEGGQKLM